MVHKLEIRLPRKFSFRHTVASHGWYDLPPFEHKEGSSELTYVFAPSGKDQAVTATIRNDRGKLTIDLSSKPRNVERIERGVRHILRLDDDMRDFYTA
ncbi:MAG TPA: hypothetical protein VEV84_06830, partial [Pyrinomonadaceae bacterium]|nr:hypothetical protein [Pyrinomonadaceae bacterium]